MIFFIYGQLKVSSFQTVLLVSSNPQQSQRNFWLDFCPMIYPLDRRNTKKTKKPKTKMLSLYQQQSYFSQIVSEEAKIEIQK